MNLFTPEDMLRYLYNEMTADERFAFVQAMENDWTLREETERFQQTLSSLDTLHYAPRPQAIQSILRYADATRPVEQ
jgi:anti-sigma-K factor RskA